MSDDLQGMVRAVVTTQAGGVGLSWAGNTLVVDDARDFPRDGGRFTVEGHGAPFTYTEVVDGETEGDPDTLTTVEPAPGGLGDEFRVDLWPIAVMSVAEVALPESLEDTVPAIIPHSLKPYLVDGVREPEAQESVIIGQRDMAWYVVDILGQPEVLIPDIVTTVDDAKAEAMEAHGLASQATQDAQDAHNAAVEAKDAAADASTAAGNAKDAADAAAQDAANAAGIAGGKADVLIQSDEPAAAYQAPTTLWIDTTDGANTPKRWDGGKWVVVTDKAATDAAADAAAAQTAASSAASAAATAQTTADAAAAAAAAAQTAAGNAQTTATNALTSANGRNSRITSTDDPSGTNNPYTGQPLVDGDTWWKWDSTTARNVIGVWTWRNGDWVAEKISHQTIASVDVNKLIVTGSTYMKQAVVEKIVGDVAYFDAFVGKTFTGGTFTGSTFRTSNSVPRVEITSAGFKAFDSNGDETVNIWGNGGRLQGTTITGGTVRTAETGPRIQMTGGLFQVVNSSGREIIKVAPNWQPPGAVPAQPALVFGANATGSPARMAIYGGDIMFMNGSYIIGSLSKSPGVDMYLDNNDGSTNTRIRNLGTQGNIYIDAGGGGIYSTSNWFDFKVSGAASGYQTWVIRPIAIGGTTRAVLQFTGGGDRMPQTTIAANVFIDVNGNFFRTSSARRFKNDIQNIGVDPYRVLDVPVRDWVDATMAMDDDTYRTRTPGVVAEEVEDAGLEQFVTYGEDGQTSGVMYDRLALLLIPVVRDLRARLERLENQA